MTYAPTGTAFVSAWRRRSDKACNAADAVAQQRPLLLREQRLDFLLQRNVIAGLRGHKCLALTRRAFAGRMKEIFDSLQPLWRHIRSEIVIRCGAKVRGVNDTRNRLGLFEAPDAYVCSRLAVRSRSATSQHAANCCPTRTCGFSGWRRDRRGSGAARFRAYSASPI